MPSGAFYADVYMFLVNLKFASSTRRLTQARCMCRNIPTSEQISYCQRMFGIVPIVGPMALPTEAAPRGAVGEKQRMRPSLTRPGKSKGPSRDEVRERKVVKDVRNTRGPTFRATARISLASAPGRPRSGSRDAWTRRLDTDWPPRSGELGVAQGCR